MKPIARLLVCVASILAAAVPGYSVVEGCTVGPDAVCEYDATVPGSIAAVGVWTVQIWWDGTCGAGAPDYTRSSAPHTAHPASPNGDNNLPLGYGGTWEGTVAAGSCARVTTGSGVALVGNVTGQP